MKAGQSVNSIRLTGRSLTLPDVAFTIADSPSIETALRSVFPDAEFVSPALPFPSCGVVSQPHPHDDPAAFVIDLLFAHSYDHDGQTLAVVLSELLPECTVQLDLWMSNRFPDGFVRTVFVGGEFVSEEVADAALFDDDEFLTLIRWADGQWELDGEPVSDAVAREALRRSNPRENRRFARHHPQCFDGSGSPAHPRHPRCSGC